MDAKAATASNLYQHAYLEVRHGRVIAPKPVAHAVAVAAHYEFPASA